MAVLTYEDKVIIKYLRMKFKHGAKRIVSDHPEKDWKVPTLNDLISKIDTTGDIDRKPGSGRPKSARTDGNIYSVKELISSQEYAPGTHLTPAEITLHLDTASESSVRRIIKDDLKLRALKKIKGQMLSAADTEKRRTRCPRLLRVYTKEVLSTAFFSDEKIFKVQQLYNAQNARVYAHNDTPKSSVDPDRLICERTGFPQYLMVSVAVSKVGKTSLHFVELKAKVDGQYYRNKILKKMIPQMNRLAAGKQYLFMQDGARAHTAGDTVEMLESQDQLQLLRPEMWPPNSPDLNPVDFCIWGELERRVYKGRRITDLDQLKSALQTEWKKFPQDIITNSIDAYTSRLRKVVQEEVGHIEHY